MGKRPWTCRYCNRRFGIDADAADPPYCAECEPVARGMGALPEPPATRDCICPWCADVYPVAADAVEPDACPKCATAKEPVLVAVPVPLLEQLTKHPLFARVVAGVVIGGAGFVALFVVTFLVLVNLPHSASEVAAGDGVRPAPPVNVVPARPAVKVPAPAPVVASEPPRPKTGRDLGRGDKATIASPDGQTTLCRGDAAWKALAEAFAAKDEIGVQNLVSAGLVRILPNGTQVLILKHGFEAHTVRVLDGEFYGESGYVIVDFLRPDVP